MKWLTGVPDDVFIHLIPFLPRRTAAALASTCTHLLHLLRGVPEVWQSQVIVLDHDGPHAHLWCQPQLAFAAHAPHITHITFGSPVSTTNYTRVSAYHLRALMACTHLQELHLRLPYTHIAATGQHLLSVLQRLRHLRVLTTPFRLVALDHDTERQLIPVAPPPPQAECARLTTLHLHGDTPVFNRWRPSCLQHLCRTSLTSLHLYQVGSLDVEHLLRTFPQLRQLHLVGCTTQRNATALPLWHDRMMTLTTLIIHQSKQVVHSLRPLITFFLSWSQPLPLAVLGGDWDDTAFMYFVSTSCCVQCARTREPADAHVMCLELCQRCITALPPPLQNLRVVKVNYFCSALPGCTNPTRETFTPR